uniref:Lipoyl-binding domain-containing protein n=1 Tax=Parastrongyloides trichosuri TaxID=131310 RepID=A0A0N4ZDA7_PARTI
MEVEAVDEGEVLEILVPEGAEGVKVNTPIARLSGDDVAPAPKKADAPAEAPKAEAPKTEAPKAETASAPAAPKSDDGGRIFASPLARRLAAQADGHSGRQLRPDPAGRHEEGRGAPHGRQHSERAALPALHRCRDRPADGRSRQGQQDAGAAGDQGLRQRLRHQGGRSGAEDGAGGQRLLHPRRHRHAPQRRRLDGGGDRRRPDHPDHQEGRDQGPGADRDRVQGPGQAR